MLSALNAPMAVTRDDEGRLALRLMREIVECAFELGGDAQLRWVERKMKATDVGGQVSGPDAGVFVRVVEEPVNLLVQDREVVVFEVDETEGGL